MRISWLPTFHFPLPQIAGAQAKYRGVRVVPEIDLPGHVTPRSFGGVPVQWCRGADCSLTGGGPKCLVLYADPAGDTLRLLGEIFEEVVPLFEDEVFHVGGDETQQDATPGNRCSTANTEARAEQSPRPALCGAHSFNATGQYRVTLSLR